MPSKKTSNKRKIVLDHVNVLSKALNEVLKVTCNNKFREPVFKLLKVESSDDAAAEFKLKLGKMMEETAHRKETKTKKTKRKNTQEVSENGDVPPGDKTKNPESSTATEDKAKKTSTVIIEDEDSDIEFIEMKPMSQSTMKRMKFDFLKQVKTEKESQELSSSSSNKQQMQMQKTAPTPSTSKTPPPVFPPSPPRSPSLLDDADMEIITYTQSQFSQCTQNSFGGSGSFPFFRD